MEEEHTTDHKSEKKLRTRLVVYDRKMAWVLSIITVLTILTGFLLIRIESQPSPSFESEFIYKTTEELGNRILIDGNYHNVDTSLFVQSRPDIFQESHYSVFDALVSVCKTNDFELLYHFDETMDTHWRVLTSSVYVKVFWICI